MTALEAVCGDYGVPLIEDAAEALGATFRERPAGSFGRVGVFSFNGNKIITTSGGRRSRFGRPCPDSNGAATSRPRHVSLQCTTSIVTSDSTTACPTCSLRSAEPRWRRCPSEWSGAAEDLRSLRRSPGSLRGHRVHARGSLARSNRWLTTLTVDPQAFGASNLDIIDCLESMNIEARPVWKPMHLQPVFSGVRTFGGAVSESIYARGLCLPSGTGMTHDDIERVVGGVLGSRSRSARARGHGFRLQVLHHHAEALEFAGAAAAMARRRATRGSRGASPRTKSRVDDVRLRVRPEPSRKADGEIIDVDRLAHVEDEDVAALAERTRLEDEEHGLGSS